MNKEASKNIIVHVNGDDNTINMYNVPKKEPSLLKKTVAVIGAIRKLLR
jgi:hypothetical protein